MEQKIGVIIVAGGSGKRCGGNTPKQFRFLGMKPVLAHTINHFADAFPQSEIVVVLPEQHIDYWKDLSARFDVAKHEVTAGGKERFFSVLNGINALKTDVDLIAVQDGVRPLATSQMILRVAEAAAKQGAAIPVVLPADSFREMCGEDSHIIDRSALRVVQTPQIFQADLLRRAYGVEFSPAFTDDASVVEHSGAKIALVEGERTNLKITTEEDFVIANAILEAREEAEEASKAKEK